MDDIPIMASPTQACKGKRASLRPPTSWAILTRYQPRMLNAMGPARQLEIRSKFAQSPWPSETGPSGKSPSLLEAYVKFHKVMHVLHVGNSDHI